MANTGLSTERSSAHSRSQTRWRLQRLCETLSQSFAHLPGKAMAFGIDYNEVGDIWYLMPAKFTTASTTVNPDSDADTINRMVVNLHRQFADTTRLLQEMLDNPLVDVKMKEITNG